MRAVGAFATAVALALLGALPAAAAPGTTKRDPHPRVVDTVTVSNPAPTRDSPIDVFSAGWRPRGVVAIALAGTDLRHVRADASGAVSAEVTIPSDIQPGDGLLSVTGASADGIPQQILTRLAIVADDAHHPSPRPWPAISLVLALATLLMLASQRLERRERETRLAG